MSKWEIVRLGDVATYINGYPFKPSEWSDKGLPIIRIQNLTGNDYETNYYDKEYSEKYLIKNGDVLISWSASLGVYEWKGENALLNQHIFKVVFDKLDVDKKYFVNAVSYLLDEMSRNVHGSTMKHITKPAFDETPFPLPPLEIQSEIAYNLDKVSETIEICRKILEKLDYLAKAKFTEMFGDVITNNMNWSSAALDDLCIIVRGGSPRPIEHFLGGSVPWIKIGDATEDDSIFLRSTKEHIIEEGVKKSRLIKSGSLIFANCGVSLGFARIITFDGCIHDGWLAFENISESLNKVFLLYSLNQITDYFRQIAPAGTQPNLNTAIMKSHTQIVPPLPLQEQFAEYVKKIDLAKSAVKKTLDKAETLKNALMQKYFG